jgi:iron complex outermembrane receptor protein
MAWVALDRAYYGAGLQYNQITQIAGLPLAWMAGYEFDQSTERRQGGSASLGEKIPNLLNREEDNQAVNNDFFAQATTLVSEKISLVTGLRASTVRLSSNDYFLRNGDGSGQVSYIATSPVLGLTYHALETLNLYANYGRGFETPTLAEVAYNGAGAPAFNTKVNASKSQHYELGAKWAPSNHSRLDFTLFKIHSTDEIVVASSSFGNTASADGYTTLNLKASHGWTLGAGNLVAYGRIDNLSDKRYVGSVIVNQSALQFFEPAPGRNWTVGLRLVLPI